MCCVSDQSIRIKNNQTAWQMLSSLLSNWRRVSRVGQEQERTSYNPTLWKICMFFFLLSVCFCDSVPRLSSVSFQTALCVAAWGFYRTYRQLGLYPPVPWLECVTCEAVATLLCRASRIYWGCH